MGPVRLVPAAFAVVFAPLAPTLAFAHQRLVEPPSRTQDTASTVGPCGGASPTGTPTELQAASTIDVRYFVEVAHGNVFRLSLGSGDDVGFEHYLLATAPDDGATGDQSITVELPACTCTGCTLQLEQLTASGNGGYYSCADVTLVGNGLPPCLFDAADDESTGGDTGGESGDSSSASSDATDGDTSTDVGADESSASTSDGAGTSSDSSTSTSGDAPSSSEAASGCGCTHGEGASWALPWIAAMCFRRRRG
jgi:hypothetical protein